MIKLLLVLLALPVVLAFCSGFWACFSDNKETAQRACKLGNSCARLGLDWVNRKAQALQTKKAK